MKYQQEYAYMYYDLLMNKLDVVLVPSTNSNRANNGCCSRAVVAKNPEWYQEFCAKYTESKRGREHKTIIKRKTIIDILSRLKDGLPTRSKYLPDLQEIAESLHGDLTLSDFDVCFLTEYGSLPQPFTDQF